VGLVADLGYSESLVPPVSPCLVLAAICGPAAEPAAVQAAAVQPTVELRLTSVDEGSAKLLEQSLRRELSDRLLQDGYRVVPGGAAASVAIWVHLDRNGARVSAHGTEERVEVIEDGDPEVVALEVLQLTTALVDEVRPREPIERAAVVLQLDGAAMDPELRERLQVGLLERGYALTRTPMPTDPRLCVVADGGELRVHVTAGDRACEPQTLASSVAAAETVELRRVLLLDEATAAIDAWSRTKTASGELAPAEPTTTREPSEDLEAPVPPARDQDREDATAEPERTPSFAVMLHGGLVSRVGGADGAFGMRLRAGRQRGLGGGLELTVIPSSATGVHVVEALPTALFDWALGFRRHGIASFGAMAGLHVHRFRQDGPTGDRGVRLAPSLGTTVRLGYLGARGLVAFGGLRAGWSGGQWVHVLDGQPTWKRSALLVGLELGVGWDFPWRRRA